MGEVERTARICIYEVNREKTSYEGTLALKFESHWENGQWIIITMNDGVEWTVNANELRKAIDSCT